MRTQKIGDVTVFGTGSAGGKGAGLIRINEYALPKTGRLTTWILSTSFYEHYLDRGRQLGDEERSLLAVILQELGTVPVGVRSSATNEAAVAAGGLVSVRAGENVSYMLPNNHPDSAVRLQQMEQAIACIYNDFIKKQRSDSPEQMAIVIDPIIGVYDDTPAGPLYYPYISGVANSYFPHALKTQDPKEGYSRIAFGHGYATVLDDFPVISMATIRNPLPPTLLCTGPGQQFFYALDMTKNSGLQGEELETMRRLHVRFANFHKIKLLGLQQSYITIEELVQHDHFGFKTGLTAIMEAIAARLQSHFQIEFVFNIDFKSKSEESGLFHVVQLTPLPAIEFGPVAIPEQPRRTYLSASHTQGHGVKRGVRFALVVSPFTYSKDKHDIVRQGISRMNRTLGERGEGYLILVPGRLGSKNRDWGINVEFTDVDKAVAIFEYGVDIAGRPQPLPEEASLTGGVYGSHFLYMVQGGYSEDQKRLQTRMYGTQGTHFLTNLVSNNIIYSYLAPLEDLLDPWLFSIPDGEQAISLLSFPNPVSIYADSMQQRCVVVEEDAP
ncbi:MAG: hypothetical protein AB1486_30085 [Planctomycetota bacterium]